MLKEAGASYVIIGHSERRTKFGETDEHVNKKVEGGAAGGLIADRVRRRDAGRARGRPDAARCSTGSSRLGLDGLTADQVAGAGGGVRAGLGDRHRAQRRRPRQAQEAHAHIRKRLREQFGSEAADACRILYGGSVKPANTKELVSQADVDGALVGGASLDPKGFSEIVAASRPGRI